VDAASPDAILPILGQGFTSYYRPSLKKVEPIGKEHFRMHHIGRRRRGRKKVNPLICA
jgi:hypothetical protein